jgi:hypothetical protein
MGCTLAVCEPKLDEHGEVGPLGEYEADASDTQGEIDCAVER